MAKKAKRNIMFRLIEITINTIFFSTNWKYYFDRSILVISMTVPISNPTQRFSPFILSTKSIFLDLFPELLSYLIPTLPYLYKHRRHGNNIPLSSSLWGTILQQFREGETSGSSSWPRPPVHRERVNSGHDRCY